MKTDNFGEFDWEEELFKQNQYIGEHSNSNSDEIAKENDNNPNSELFNTTKTNTNEEYTYSSIEVPNNTYNDENSHKESSPSNDVNYDDLKDTSYATNDNTDSSDYSKSNESESISNKKNSSKTASYPETIIHNSASIDYLELAGCYTGMDLNLLYVSMYSSPDDDDILGTVEYTYDNGTPLFSGEIELVGPNVYHVINCSYSDNIYIGFSGEQ